MSACSEQRQRRNLQGGAMMEGLIRAWEIIGNEIERTSEEVPSSDMSADQWRTYLEMRRRMTRMRSAISNEIAKEEAKLRDATSV